MYIRRDPNPSGAYPPPQSNAAPGLLYFPDELVPQLVAYNGFVTLTVNGEAATAAAPNMEVWETWKAAEAETKGEEVK